MTKPFVQLVKSGLGVKQKGLRKTRTMADAKLEWQAYARKLELRIKELDDALKKLEADIIQVCITAETFMEMNEKADDKIEELEALNKNMQQQCNRATFDYIELKKKLPQCAGGALNKQEAELIKRWGGEVKEEIPDLWTPKEEELLKKVEKW